MKNRKLKFKKSFAPIILAVFSIFSMIYQTGMAAASQPWKNITKEMVVKWDKRIQPLRQSLPVGIQHVGYLDKSMIPPKINKLDGEELFLMQYSIAPVVLEAGSFKYPWIIGNFDNDTVFRPWLDKKIKNYEVQHFGFGLYLIHNLGK